MSVDNGAIPRFYPIAVVTAVSSNSNLENGYIPTHPLEEFVYPF